MTNRIATASVAREIDGDTFVVDALDPGWGVNVLATHPSDQRCHVRLAGVNCPDSRPSAKWYDPALSHRASLYFAMTWPPGTKVVLESYGIDDFGRTLAAVQAEAPNGTLVDVAADLVQQGYARTGDYPTPTPET